MPNSFSFYDTTISRGHAFDNILIERLWLTLKYENVYVNEYPDGISLHKGVTDYFRFYNYERRHRYGNALKLKCKSLY
jgi:transposase InsO family protein